MKLSVFDKFARLAHLIRFEGEPVAPSRIGVGPTPQTYKFGRLTLDVADAGHQMLLSADDLQVLAFGGRLLDLTFIEGSETKIESLYDRHCA